MKDIEVEWISLPTVNSGAKGEKPPSKGWKKKPASPNVLRTSKTIQIFIGNHYPRLNTQALMKLKSPIAKLK